MSPVRCGPTTSRVADQGTASTGGPYWRVTGVAGAERDPALRLIPGCPVPAGRTDRAADGEDGTGGCGWSLSAVEQALVLEVEAVQDDEGGQLLSGQLPQPYGRLDGEGRGGVEGQVRRPLRGGS
jgi:hypothetical protein